MCACVCVYVPVSILECAHGGQDGCGQRNDVCLTVDKTKA